MGLNRERRERRFDVSKGGFVKRGRSAIGLASSNAWWGSSSISCPVAYNARQRGRHLSKPVLAVLMLGTPLLAAVASCIGLVRDWKNTERLWLALPAVALATVVAVYAFGCLIYVEFGGLRPAFDYSLETYGFILALFAIIASLIALGSARWFSMLALLVSAWLLTTFFLMGLTF